jgi:hypothetical protein
MFSYYFEVFYLLAKLANFIDISNYLNRFQKSAAKIQTMFNTKNIYDEKNQVCGLTDGPKLQIMFTSFILPNQVCGLTDGTKLQIIIMSSIFLNNNRNAALKQSKHDNLYMNGCKSSHI